MLGIILLFQKIRRQHTDMFFKGFGKIGRIRKAAAIGDFGHGAVGFDQQLFRRVQAIGDKVFDWTLMQTALKAAQVSRWLICAQAAIWASVSFSA